MSDEILIDESAFERMSENAVRWYMAYLSGYIHGGR
jgi:hypothetical protein